ncbi:MAG: dTMP kinase [Xanthobacteraceae bacterium]
MRERDTAGPSAKPNLSDRQRGKFITFEGGEGTGKSTQAAMLALRLEALGHAVLLTREPGGSPGAEIIRHVLLSGAAKPLGPQAEAMLFAAARQDHVQLAIEPALEAGKWVICDRFADSTRVYQGALGKVDLRLIKALERVCMGDLLPDLTFILDLPVEAGLQRLAQRRGDAGPDRFEAEDVEFHENLRRAYLALSADEPQRCMVIDAGGTKEEIAKQIWTAVTSRLNPAAPVKAESMAPLDLTR